MAIVKRFPVKKTKPVKKGSIVRRNFTGLTKTFADNVEEYVFSLPPSSLPYAKLVLDWVVPYQQTEFILFGQKMKLFPRYDKLIDNTVVITGLFCEVSHPTKPKRHIVEGPRGTWHGKIKFFVKTTMQD